MRRQNAPQARRKTPRGEAPSGGAMARAAGRPSQTPEAASKSPADAAQAQAPSVVAIDEMHARDEVDAVRELVDGGTLGADIVDANLRVGDTAAEARLGVGLALNLAVAASRACARENEKRVA